MDILPVFHMDKNHQRSYFEGPYIVKADELVGEGKYLHIRRVTSLMNYSESLTSIAMLTYQTIPIWKAVLKQILSSSNLSFKIADQISL